MGMPGKLDVRPMTAGYVIRSMGQQYPQCIGHPVQRFLHIRPRSPEPCFHAVRNTGDHQIPKTNNKL